MKTAILIKLFLFLPLILFVDYIVMALLGCITCLFGIGDGFYCGPFCVAGKILIALSGVGFMILLLPEIKLIAKNIRSIFKNHK